MVPRVSKIIDFLLKAIFPSTVSMNKGVAAAADKGLPFWHDKALNAVKVVALYFSYRPTVEFFKDTIGLELTDTALCAIFVSIIYAAACSLPVEYVMIQIQNMQPDAEGKYPYTGFLDCAVKTYKAGGILKFYTGFPLYCVRISIGVMMACIAINNLGDGRKVAGYCSFTNSPFATCVSVCHHNVFVTGGTNCKRLTTYKDGLIYIKDIYIYI